jgi:predicted transcriptional regulator
MKIRPMGAQLLHADERTNITKLIVAFHNSVQAHKNCTALHVLFHVFTTTTIKHSCCITVDTVPVLNVCKVFIDIAHNKTRLISVIKYIITDAFLNASFSPTNYWGIFVRPL